MLDRRTHEMVLTRWVGEWPGALRRLMQAAASCGDETRELCFEEVAELCLHYRDVKAKLEILRSAPAAAWRDVKLEVDDAWFALQLGTASMESRLGLVTGGGNGTSVLRERPDSRIPAHGD